MRRIKKSDIQLGSLSEISGTDPIEIPVVEYSQIAYELPVTGGNQFGQTVDPLGVLPENAGDVTDRITSLIRAQTVEEAIFVTQIGVVAIPDIRMWALNGVDMAHPQAMSDSPLFTGFVPPAGVPIGGAPDASSRPATLQFGHDALRAAWAFLNAYNLVMTLGSRYEIFNEVGANVGACVSGSVSGFGTSNYSPVDDIARANERQQLAYPSDQRMFVPPTVTGPANALTPREPPLVQVQYGSLQLAGAFGGWYPTRGLFLVPGMPVNIRLERTPSDTFYHAQLAQAVRDRSRVFNTYAKNLNGTATGAGWAGTKLWSAGLFKIGIIMRGYNLAPRACIEAYQDSSRFWDPRQKAQLFAPAQSMLLQQLTDLAKNYKLCRTDGTELGRERFGDLAGLDEVDFRKSEMILSGP